MTDASELSQSEIVLTGDRPTGPLHLGHYAGSLRNRVALQDIHQQTVLIADLQALTDHAGRPRDVRRNVLEVALDYLAVGIDPSKSTIALQSAIPELAELTLLYLNLVTLARLERNPTVRSEIREKVRAMFTDPAHVRASDPGHVEGNVVFAYLEAFDPRRDEVAELERRYRAGGLGDVALKRRLEELLQSLLEPVRSRRELLARDSDSVMAMIRAGTERAQPLVAAVLADVREVFFLSRAH